MKKNWKTTLFGALAAAAGGIAIAPDIAPAIGKIAAALSPIFAGIASMFARDYNVTSEQTGLTNK